MLTVKLSNIAPFVVVKFHSLEIRLQSVTQYQVRPNDTLFVRFFTLLILVQDPQPIAPTITNPCYPSPCGPNSECRNIGDNPSCSCLTGYLGSPPHCRPECTINSECSSNLACIKEKCRDPCSGSCGVLASCAVINHIPICTCPEGYTGDPFRYCEVKPPKVEPIADDKDLCNPFPCGANAQCANSLCTCLPGYHGDPYSGCRPECVLSTDCSKDKACIRNKCVNPCPGTCGQNAECNVINHIPMCVCLQGYTGNAFFTCSPILGKYFYFGKERLNNTLFQLKQNKIHVIRHLVVLTVNAER